MGKKVTIDSSTMVNKGLEIMEAGWLFHVDMDQIRVIIQPQSIVHSMVMFEDGAVMAQMGVPDMKLPIQYALYYPQRKSLSVDRLDFWKTGSILFEKPDEKLFPALRLACHAGETGGSLPTVFNAADEAAVEEFLSGKIRYTDIVKIIRRAMQAHEKNGILKFPSAAEIMDIRKATIDFVKSKTGEKI